MFSWTTLLIEWTWGRVKYPSTKLGFTILLIVTILAVILIYPVKLFFKILLN